MKNIFIACLLISVTGVAVAAIIVAATSEPTTPVDFAWDESPSSNIVNYRLYIGTNKGIYTDSYDFSTNHEGTVTRIVPGVTYHATVSAISEEHGESDPAVPIVFILPGTSVPFGPPRNLRIP